MSMIFKFRMLCDENDDFLRDYEVMYNMTLLDFHDFICEDLGYDDAAISSFFTADRLWEKDREFTLLDMGAGEDGGPAAMSDVKVNDVIIENGDRWLYVFDMFGDRALYLEMAGAHKSEEGAAYPRVTLSQGEAPAQFDASRMPAGDSIVAAALDEFRGFVGRAV